MVVAKNVIFALELIGTIAFSVSGSVAAINKRNDIFGVIFLGVTTAVGGGIIRDILIGDFPPKVFSNYIYVAIAAATSVIVFIIVFLYGEKFQDKISRIDSINNIFDAVGLGVFTIYGMDTAMERGYSSNVFLVVFLGLITGVGGGIIRDTLINEVPFVLRKKVYAVASLFGGMIYYEMNGVGINNAVCVVAGILIIFIIRILATRFRWDLPKAVQCRD